VYSLGGGRIRESSGGVHSTMKYLIYCKNIFVNATMYPQHNNKKKSIVEW
jgi:hypothetical protein